MLRGVIIIFDICFSKSCVCIAFFREFFPHFLDNACWNDALSIFGEHTVNARGFNYLYAAKCHVLKQSKHCIL